MEQLSKAAVDIPGIDEDMRSAIEEIIDEFEEKHEADVVNEGNGWVPRIEKTDYIIAGSINLIFIIWLIIALA